MPKRFEFCVGRFQALVTTALIAASVVTVAGSPAQARRHHGFHRQAHVHVHHRQFAHRHPSIDRTVGVARSGYLRPTYASIIVDANTGRTLSAENESAPHHPASITKVMTLYLLFEQMEKGRFTLESELSISPHAAAQSPTKLGLRPGSTIDVEDAIKAVVTKSANDIAVAIAENIAGDEETFAEQMTQRARSLGMRGTTYKNASGLPNPQQITTARDLAILGRAIQDRFPRYYKYFATRSFYYGGRAIPNHNHLLGRVEGMDGIKTGYTSASGFNLLTSVRRDGRHIIGVVLGGRSGGQRDTIMAGLIADTLPEASAHRTAVAITERDDDTAMQSARIMEQTPDVEDAAPPTTVARIETRQPVAVAEIKPEPRKVTVAALDLSVPAPPAHIEPRAEKPRPAFVTAMRAEPEATEQDSPRAKRRAAAADGSTGRALAYAPATATPSSLRWVEGARGKPAPRAQMTEKTADKVAAKGTAGHSEQSKAESRAERQAEKLAEKQAEKQAEKITLVRPSQSGWMIQIGATDDADKAHDLLTRAKAKAGLASAKPFTEKVQKGGGTLWRARFAGLEEGSAEAACRTLKRSGFSCFATKN